jgi:hypothetical protein
MSIDVETKKILRELYAETQKLLEDIKENVPINPKTGGVYSSAAISTRLAKDLLEKIDPDYFNA